MAEIEEFDLPLPDKQKEILLEIVRISRKHKMLSVQYSCSKDPNQVYYLSMYFNDIDHPLHKLSEDPIPGFEILGFVKTTSDRTFFITPKAFKWADYQNKNRFVRWCVRFRRQFKDFMLGFAFVMTLLLTLLEILKIFKISPFP